MPERRDTSDLRDLIGQPALWTFVYREGQVQTLVRIVDVRKLWNRIDVQVETNAGSKVWASTETVQPLLLDQEKRAKQES